MTDMRSGHYGVTIIPSTTAADPLDPTFRREYPLSADQTTPTTLSAEQEAERDSIRTRPPVAITPPYVK